MKKLNRAVFGEKIVPYKLSRVHEVGHGFYYKGREFVLHTRLDDRDSAVYRIINSQKLFIFVFVYLLIFFAIITPAKTLIVVVGSLTLLYFSDLLFNLYLIFRSLLGENQINITEKELLKINNKDLPKYTIYCPLYKEWNVLPQFIKAISELDYPSNKLEVMLLLEEDDKQTIAVARKTKLPKYFKIIVVPHSYPKTKPKALNYGLLKTTGEYCVIYDAEDIPDKDQLKKAYLAFQKVGKKVKCIQAKLNFYNPHQNILTRLFTAEYCLWFDLVLTGLQTVGAPIPLGGTSNHFRTKDILLLDGWDPFNVTEDADLGMRIAKRGFTTAVLNSDTMEEANSSLPNWFKQRSRWVKGYIQTYLVHMRYPREFLRSKNKTHILTFQLVIGGKVLSMLINPFMWLITLLYFIFKPVVGDSIESLFPGPVFYMALASLIFGNFLYLYYYMIGAARREHWGLIVFSFLVPIYWLFMSIATFIAVFELFAKPHKWNKTKHGLHLAK